MSTIQDVAREAGVSPATVSRVLNHPDIVVEEKRERVQAAIARLGFEPSAPARYLRMGSSRALALLVGDISQPFHGRFAKAVEVAAEARGFAVMLGDLDHREDRLAAFLSSSRKRGVAGVIIATADDLGTASLEALIQRVVGSGTPVVTTSQQVSVPDVPAVTFDYAKVGEEVADLLLREGRTRIALLGGGRSSGHSRELESGVRRALRRQDARLSVLNGRFRHEPAKVALSRLAGRGTMPDGVISANTPMALGALRALHELGLNVPEDTSLVTCEDVPDSPYLVPSLTAVDSDLDSLGSTSVDLLLQRINGESAPARTVLPHRIVIRESSRGPT